jgi:hypothetical protein
MDRKIYYFTSCQSSERLAIVLSLARVLQSNVMKDADAAKRNEEKRGVDEINETLHNLAPVLMNTTLQQQALPVFKKLQSINVGV